ncbi:hypothetical protein JW964_20045, partial [candidate division KSB1 bacterium]|nr:hypothetical protein [candidate division KSB1 bacterium]
MFKNFNHLGGRSYYTHMTNPTTCVKEFGEIIDKFPALSINPAAVYCFMLKSYLAGDQTLISGIQRSPWMTKIDQNSKWVYSTLPEHGNQRASVYQIANKLFKLLRNEALGFLNNKKTVGLLLSGGMDSRIIAGIFRSLQEDGLFSGNIIAITWGMEKSRDIAYSERIARHFKWEHITFPLTAELLHKNIFLAAERGCEISPIHFHAMSSVSTITGIDGIIAASYGDSIGRGEYSGKKHIELPLFIDHTNDRMGLFSRALKHSALTELKKDIAEYRERFPRPVEWQYREIEMQSHYMRRKLNACMEVIDDGIPVYQMFGAPEVFGYMWGLNPDCRNDKVYFELLKILPGELSAIPWARNGKKYGSSSDIPEDNFFSLHNRYGEWIKRDCAPAIKNLLLNGSLQNLGIFNLRTLDYWAKNFH